MGFLTHERVEVVGRACRTLGILKVDYATPALMNLMKTSRVNGGSAAIALIHVRDDEVTHSINWAGMDPELSFPVRKQFFRSMACSKSPKSCVPSLHSCNLPKINW